MKQSDTRILTTHVGSLPRARELSDLLIAAEALQPVDEARLDALAAAGVRDVVSKQVAAGLDIINDGEQPRVGFQTYVSQRLEGFGGSSIREPFKDFADYPDFADIWIKRGMVMSKVFDAPLAQSEVLYKDLSAATRECDLFDAALAEQKGKIIEPFMTAASPGIVCTTLRNAWYDSHETYVRAVAQELRKEYELIVQRGYVLQLDCPDLALSRHMLFTHLSDDEFLKVAATHVAALEHALQGLPQDRIRLHICWGNYEGPHVCDIDMAKVFPLLMKVPARYILFETANPRHGHEWTVFRDRAREIPDDKVLVPGAVDTTTNFVEHPDLVAQRLERFTNVVGRERVIAGSDCGFGTFAGFGAVDPEIAWSKLAALKEGARRAK